MTVLNRFRSGLLAIALYIAISGFGFSSLANNQQVTELQNYSLKYAAQTSASKNDIWAHWVDVPHWKDFDERLQYSNTDNGALLTLGSKGVLKGTGAPKTKFEVTEWQKGERFTLSLKLPLWQTVELQRYFEDNKDGQTVFVHEVNFKGGIKPVMYAVLCAPFKKDLKLVVDALKNLAEGTEVN